MTSVMTLRGASVESSRVESGLILFINTRNFRIISSICYYISLGSEGFIYNNDTLLENPGRLAI